MSRQLIKKIGILSFPGHWNQGANLTAHALQQFLLSKGHEVKNVHLCMNYKLFKNPIYTDFSEKFIKMTARCAYGDGDMQQFNDEFDTFITGSDQVWRYEQSDVFTWKEKFISSFFLGFARPGKRRISVAASFGTEQFDAPDSIRKIAAQELKRYTAISVRETSGAGIVKELTGKEVNVLVDPVFYLPRQYWIDLCESGSSPSSQECVVYNSFFVTPWIKAFFSKHDHLEAIDLLSLPTMDWMRHIRDARFVITDSFHVACYCLIFGTPFACLCSEQWGISRLYGLAESFGFSTQRVIDVENTDDVNAAISDVMQQEIDWQRIWNCIEEQRHTATEWIEAALHAPVPSWVEPAFHEASSQQCQTERNVNQQWRVRRMLEKKIRICRFLLKFSPLIRTQLKAKLDNLETHYNRLSW